MKKLTIIKICGKNYLPTKEDLEHWKQIFNNTKITNPEKYNVISNGDVEIQQIDCDTNDDKTITFVKIGSEHYIPTLKDLENWREVFKEAQEKNEPDFKIFCGNDVEITQIHIGDIIAIE